MKELEFPKVTQVLRYLLINCHRANIWTIRNMKCILLGGCIFNVYGFQFENLWQVESISVPYHANVPKSIYLLSIKGGQGGHTRKPNNSLYITAHSQIQGDESCLYPLKMNTSPAGKSGKCLSKPDIVCLPDSILFLCTADYKLLPPPGVWLTTFFKDLQELPATQSSIIIYLLFTDPYFQCLGIMEVRAIVPQPLTHTKFVLSSKELERESWSQQGNKVQ